MLSVVRRTGVLVGVSACKTEREVRPREKRSLFEGKMTDDVEWYARFFNNMRNVCAVLRIPPAGRLLSADIDDLPL